MNEPINILVISDRTVERMGIGFLLRGLPNLLIVGEATSCREARLMARTTRPGIVIVDYEIFQKEGPGPIWRLCQENVGLTVVFMTAANGTAQWISELDPCEFVCVRKDATPEELAGIIWKVVEINNHENVDSQFQNDDGGK